MAKGTKVTAKQAQLAAAAMKNKKMAPVMKPPVVDAEDKLDGGVDEDTEG